MVQALSGKGDACRGFLYDVSLEYVNAIWDLDVQRCISDIS
jgi:hypothetical protein